ncbi:MAG: SusC/RagA family TonB-linked outer membrane protein [Bacteroidota bacterium]
MLGTHPARFRGQVTREDNLINKPKPYKNMIFFKHRYPIIGANRYILIGGRPISFFGLPKALKVLNFTLLFIFMICFRVAAVVNAQQINLTLKDVSLETAFKEIKKQTGYGFMYDKEELARAAKISVSIQNGTVKETLNQCLKDQPYTYEIFDKTIVVKRRIKKNGNFINNDIDLIIKGKVTDEKGAPISGVSVTLLGTNKVAITNKEGKFSIEVTDENSVLQFSYLGYGIIEQTIERDRFFNIVLKEEASTLQSVEINAGYYTVKERERTGSISKITSETIEKQPVNNPLMALQNRVPGLQITQQTGVAGGGFSVLIRGRNSISSGTDPLYIIDGVIFPSAKMSANSSATIYMGANPLSTINPDDIQNIEVLKDADATAIYGARGANGVILITTKQNKTGKSNVSASIIRGFSEVAHKIDMLNTEQYLAMRMEAFKNDNLNPTSRDYDVNGAWDKNSYTDWQKLIIGSNAYTTNASLNLSGGGDNSNYMLSGNYYSEGTVFASNSKYDRAGLHTNINFGNIRNRLTAQFTGSFSHIKSNLLRTDPTYLINLPPNQPNPYDEFGNLNWANNTVFNNPMSELMRLNLSGTDTFLVNVLLNYRILNSLNFKVSAGYSTIKRNEEVSFPASSWSPATTNYNNPASRISDFSDNFNNNAQLEPFLSYNGKVWRGKLEALAGMSIQENNSQLSTVRGTGFSSDELMGNLSSAATVTINELKYVKYRYISGFGRLNYNLSNKYFLNLTARRDGSTRFGLDKRFAYFGAIGAAWVFSDEKLFKDYLPFISFGKLRGSWGITGNDQILDYQYLQLWNNSSGTYQGNPTLAPIRIANPDFAWETNKKTEIALQIGFLKDKLRFETAFYRNISSDQLVGMNLPLSVAFSVIQSNLPATVLNSGLEFDLNWNILDKKEHLWSIGFNLSIPKNKLLKYPGLETSNNRTSYAVGESLNIRKVYNTSVNPTTGIYTFEDYDGNGSLNAEDRYIIKFLGQYYYGAVRNSFKYKNFNFEFLVSFTKQNGNNYMATIPFAPGYWTSNSPLVNQPSIVLSRWQNPNDDSTIQRFTTSSPVRTYYTTAKGDGGLQIGDASFIRLKNIAISYDLPKKWTSLLKLKSAQFSLQGQNLYTLTKYVGLDPETQSMTTLPPLRTLAMGIKVNL